MDSGLNQEDCIVSSNKSLSENSRVIGQCSNTKLIKPPVKQNSVESSAYSE